MDFTVILTSLINNADYGWVAVITALLVAIAGAVMFISKAVVSIVHSIKVLKKEVKPASFKAQVYCESDVSGLMRTIRHDTRADRVLIYQFHNGIHSIVNNSLWKVSVSHESLNPNIPSVISKAERWPFNYLGKYNKEVTEGNHVKVVNVGEEYRNPDSAEVRGFLGQMKVEGVKSIYMFPLVDSLGFTFGMGMVQYMREPVELEEEWVYWCRDRFRAIGILLAGAGNVYE